MSYTANIPQATDDPSQSQPLILANFQQLNTQFGTNLSTGGGGDHVLFSASTGNGSHNRVTFLNEVSAIDAVKQAGINEVLFFGETQSGITMPYYTRDNIAVATTKWPVSPIKAYANFLPVSGSFPVVLTPLDSFNITSITQTALFGITIVMTNACRTSTYGILMTINSMTFIGYTFSPNVDKQTLAIEFSTSVSGKSITIAILET
jgi:hypothetical protein